MAAFLRVDVEDRLAVVTIDRPPVNALNSTLLGELTRTFEGFATRRDLGAVVLTGAGDKAFVAGADIAEMVTKSGLEMRAFSELGGRVGRAIERAPQPVIAAVNGYALGGGCELALACDIRIASDRAKFSQPEVNLGIIPGFGGSQRLTRLVGAGWASEMILTGDMVDATTAERIGLVTRVVPHGKLMEEAKALARKVLEKGPRAVALAKAAIHQAQETSLAAGLSFETEAFGLAGATADKREGMTAFLEKRKPAFKNE
jgi:enoyl-CoA hydratase